jgi:hypothetical protein
MDSMRSTRAAAPALAAVIALTTAAPAFAQSTRDIPADTVVRVRLDEPLSSKTARQSQQFSTTVTPEDRSGFPEGTRLIGTVTEAQPNSKDRPGVLGMKFRTAILPGGARVPINGHLASTREEDLRRADDGRILARRSKDSKFDLKWVGYGAGAGAILSAVLGGDFLDGALLGALGGAAYGYFKKEKAAKQHSDVFLSKGTVFGVRVYDRVAFRHDPKYRYASAAAKPPVRTADFERDRRVERELERDEDFPRAEREPRELPSEPQRRRERIEDARERPADLDEVDPVVRVNGRLVDFGRVGPRTIGGTLYVPLRAVAEEAGFEVDNAPGERTFSIETESGRIRGQEGDRTLTWQDGFTERLADAPLLIGGEIFVPAEYFSRAAAMRVDWDRSRGELTLERSRERR